VIGQPLTLWGAVQKVEGGITGQNATRWGSPAIADPLHATWFLPQG